MDYLEFERELASLHCGQLRIKPPGENGLTEVASGWTGDLKRYIAALEAGYRIVCEELDRYRRQERIRKATSGKLVRELTAQKWSKGAALGYAAMGMRQAAFSPPDMICVLEAMEDAMEIYSLEEAAEAHQDLLEGRRTGKRILRTGQTLGPSSGRCAATFPPGGRLGTEDGETDCSAPRADVGIRPYGAQNDGTGEAAP